MKENIFSIIHKPKIIIPIVAVLAIGVGIYGYSRIGRLPAYQYATVALGNVSGDISLSGAVKAADTVSLSFPKGGRIASVSVHTGQHVSAGALLASLESQDSLGALNQAKGGYEAAQANYAKIVHGATGPDVDVAKAALATAASNLSGMKNQQDTAVANAHRVLLSSGLAAVPSTGDSSITHSPIISGAYNGDTEGQYVITPYAGGDGIYFSVSGLEDSSGKIGMAAPQPLGTHGLYVQFPDGFSVQSSSKWIVSIPNTQGSNYVANYNAYQAALTARDQNVANAQAQYDQAQANLNLKIAAARPEDIQSAQAQMDSAQGAYQAALGAYRNNLVTAPINGTVTLVDATVGENAVPNKTVVSLISDNKFQIDMFVSADDLSKVALGTQAEVTLDAYPDTPLEGHVVDVESGSSVTDSRAQYKVTVEIDSADARVQSGLSAHVLFSSAKKQNVIFIPRTALITENGKHSVLVRRGNTVQSVDIETGVIGGDNVEVVSGVQVGDSVVVVGGSTNN